MIIFSLFLACIPKSSSHTTNPEVVVSTDPPHRVPVYTLPETEMISKDIRTSWPPTSWTSAKAYSFNQVDFGPGVELYAYKDGVWSTNITQEKELTKQQAHDALELNHRLGGTLIVSKCAFPRHAVVFFDANDQPVASINVCFSCGDILVWPPYSLAADWNQQRFSQQGSGDMPHIFSAHEQILPVWNSMLLKQMGLPEFSPEP